MKSFYAVIVTGIISILTGCQAPGPVIEAADLADQLTTIYRSSIQERINQYSLELASSWERELEHIFREEISNRANPEGFVSKEDVLTLIGQQQQVRKENHKRLSLERKADAAAMASTQEIDKLRGSIRRWMAAGMTSEERDKVYRIAGESARRAINDN
jgi:hypothetical protein